MSPQLIFTSKLFLERSIDDFDKHSLNTGKGSRYDCFLTWHYM